MRLPPSILGVGNARNCPKVKQLTSGGRTHRRRPALPGDPGPPLGSFSLNQGERGFNLPQTSEQGEGLRTESQTTGPKSGRGGLRGVGEAAPAPGPGALPGFSTAPGRPRGPAAPRPASPRCPQPLGMRPRYRPAPRPSSPGAPASLEVPQTPTPGPQPHLTLSARQPTRTPARPHAPGAECRSPTVEGASPTRSLWRRSALRRPTGAKPRGRRAVAGRVMRLVRLRTRHSSRLQRSARSRSAGPPPATSSAGQSVTHTEVERSGQRGHVCRSPECCDARARASAERAAGHLPVGSSGARSLHTGRLACQVDHPASRT